MNKSIKPSELSTIIIACEAGMGSSLMSVNALKKKFKKAGITTVKVMHKPARAIPTDAKLILFHQSLEKLVRGRVPEAMVIPFKHFFKDPAFDSLVESFVQNTEITQ